MRQQVWRDLTGSPDPTIIAGFSSIGKLIELIAAWANDQRQGSLRVLLGSEPFVTERSSFASPETAFTEEVREYWLEDHGISLRSSAKVVQAIDLLDAGRVSVSFVHGRTRLHAKVYVGAEAATVGSSNFTSAGLGDQIEANARLERASDPQPPCSRSRRQCAGCFSWVLVRDRTWSAAVNKAVSSVLIGGGGMPWERIAVTNR